MDASAYLSQLIALLPLGDALAREPGSRLERLLSVPAAELARVDGRVEALLLESDPARTTEMLADWERALGLPDICYPNFQFSRASKAWYFDGAGVLREAAVDEPRFSYDVFGQKTEAVLVEAEARNSIRNSGCDGAVAGTPGTFPTHWAAFGNGAGLSWNIVGSGSDAGLRYVDVRISGTSSSVTSALLRMDQLYAAASVGQPWTHSLFIQRVAGSLSGISNVRLYITEWNAGGGFLGQQASAIGVEAVSLPAARRALSVNLISASVGLVGSQIDIVPQIGVAIDCTLRIACPQLEPGSVATSPILNPVGAPAATIRAADISYVATVEERRARILARLIERFEPTPAAIIGLATRLGSSVTLTEFRPHDVADDCEAPVLDDAWAHAFQVTGTAQQVVDATCEDTCETPLRQWRTGAYECAIRRFAPAHTVPIFSYA
jgi:uncharacterized protein YmfQ (DUF2313 family)